MPHVFSYLHFSTRVSNPDMPVLEDTESEGNIENVNEVLWEAAEDFVIPCIATILKRALHTSMPANRLLLSGSQLSQI